MRHTCEAHMASQPRLPSVVKVRLSIRCAVWCGAVVAKCNCIDATAVVCDAKQIRALALTKLRRRRRIALGRVCGHLHELGKLSEEHLVRRLGKCVAIASHERQRSVEVLFKIREALVCGATLALHMGRHLLARRLLAVRGVLVMSPECVGSTDLAELAPDADLVARFTTVVGSCGARGLRTTCLVAIDNDLALVLVEPLENIFEQVVDHIRCGHDLHIDMTAKVEKQPRIVWHDPDLVSVALVQDTSIVANNGFLCGGHWEVGVALVRIACLRAPLIWPCASAGVVVDHVALQALYVAMPRGAAPMRWWVAGCALTGCELEHLGEQICGLHEAEVVRDLRLHKASLTVDVDGVALILQVCICGTRVAGPRIADALKLEDAVLAILWQQHAKLSQHLVRWNLGAHKLVGPRHLVTGRRLARIAFEVGELRRSPDKVNVSQPAALVLD
mmetsp:Transcript_2552/g.5299  ORF Transcript_2552/g.5299 Transcript_2552/m.5299 type:complete len:447 (-) Transcript_2552:667-2007(-)